jgi:hypothetical protein
VSIAAISCHRRSSANSASAGCGGGSIIQCDFGSLGVGASAGLVSNVELAWEHEVYRRAREHIGRYVRVLGVGRFQRQTCSRADIQRQFDSVLGLDANDRLGDIRAPTLVLNVTGDRAIPPAFGRYLAEHIPGARYVQFQGEDHFCWVMPSWRELMDCWIEFVTGRTPVARSERRFATVLFTDIVDSTARSTELGDDRRAM